MSNVMAALPNVGGALCSTPQLGSRPLLECRVVMLRIGLSVNKSYVYPRSRIMIFFI